MIYTSVFKFLESCKPLNGEFLGVDVGAKKTGIAVSIMKRKMSVPSGVIYLNSEKALADELVKQAGEKDCNYIVLGFPFAWEEMPSAKRIMRLASRLSLFNMKVLLYDENRTSVRVKQTAFDARGKMTKKELQNYDAQVASLILANALDEINVLNV